MKHRDWAGWIVFIVAGAATYVTAHFDKFPWLPHQYQGLVEMIGAIAAGVGAKYSASGLSLSPEGQVKEAIEKPLETPTLPQPPVLPPAAVLLLVLLLPGVAHAQVGTQPLAWQPANRSIAGAISNWAIVGQSVGTGYVAVKDWREGKHRTAYRSGCSIGLAMAISTPLKHLVGEPRPDGSDNLSWPSGHSTATAALSGWNFTVGVPIAALTGVLKLDENVHHPKDVLSGWAIGAGAQAICSALIR